MNILPHIREAVRWNPAAQFEAFQKIYDKKRNLVSPKANIHQQRINAVVVAAVKSGRPCRIIGLKPRQKGSSTFAVQVGHTRLKAKPGIGLIAGGNHFQGKNLFKILNTYAKNDDLDQDACKVMDREARYSNGSTMERITLANDDAGRSGTYQFLIVTEAAYLSDDGVANADDVLDGLLKCVPLEPETVIIVESTANGACYDELTEVLTDNGWVFFKDLTGNESILTKNPITGKTYYQPEWEKQTHHHKGEMVVFQASNVSLRVTPNHSMWMARQKGKMKFTSAESVRGKTTDYYFERKMDWDVDGLDGVVIPSYTHKHGNGFRTHEEKVIPISTWLRFMGHFLTDGNVIWRKGQKHVVLTQVKFQDDFRESATDMAEALGCNIIEYEHGNGIRMILSNAQLASYLKDYTQPKRIPRNLLMELNRKQCQEFINHLYAGDGCIGRRTSANGNGSDYGRIYAGLDKGFSDDLQELYLKAGYGASEIRKGGNCYVASFTHEDRACVKFNNPPIFEDGCDEIVHCVTLPKDHLLMVRRNGQSVWCGNSGYFYDKYQEAITIDEFLAGRNGYVKVFSAWFEFEDSWLEPSTEGIASRDDLTVQEIDYEAEIGRELSLGQFAWMRYALRDECKGDWDKFKQDYPSDDDSAFLRSGRCAFDVGALKYQSDLAKRTRREFGNLVYDERLDRVTWASGDERGSMLVRFEDRIRGCRYLVSIDPMTGEDQTGGDDPDSHSVLVMRDGYMRGGRWIEPAVVMRNVLVPGTKPNTLCCWWDIDVLEEQVFRMARYWGALVVPEMNKDRGMVELLKLRDGVDIYKRRIFNRREQVEMDALGWMTDKVTRPMVIDGLVTRIRKAGKGEIGGGIEVRCPWAVAQMGNFVRKPSGRCEAMTGKHDDDVLALAIGAFCLESATPWFGDMRVGDDDPWHGRTPEREGSRSWSV